MYQLPFARGLQYQAAVITMEGGDISYVSTHDELEDHKDLFSQLSLNTTNIQEDEEDLTFA